MEDTTEKMKHSLQVEPSQSMATAQNHESPLGKIFMVASIATGIQFIWALQLSLLTPYVQLLGIPHKLASLIWLCGPIAGIVVQPITGYYSDNCTSRFGRRRPYIAAGTAFIIVGFCDIATLTGELGLGNSIKPRAIIVFVDFVAFCYSQQYFYSCFFLSITILIIVTTLAISFVKEELNPTKVGQTNTTSIDESTTKKVPFFIGMISAMKYFPKSMWILLLVTFMNIFAWFPYMMFGTDWMAREVYGGKVGEGDSYYQGVHVGSLGLMIQAIMLGVTSLGIELLARGLGGGVNKLWGFSNFLLAICLCSLVLITKLAESSRRYTTARDGRITPMPPKVRIKAGALALFGVTNVVPYTLASIYSDISTTGQGLSVGVLNLAVVIPQLLVSLLSGPWDDLFGGGNLPSFIVGAFVAAASGVVALSLLPSPSSNDTTKDKSSAA
ncbi:hypothetical protein Leryth_025614 [Lithospermum erythrorhizon]|nr:hypothetical protein Leryth_025614 [Lithospermum erythrorhizon]